MDFLRCVTQQGEISPGGAGRLWGWFRPRLWLQFPLSLGTGSSPGSGCDAGSVWGRPALGILAVRYLYIGAAGCAMAALVLGACGKSNRSAADDDRASAVRRVVSLTPSSTEIVAAAGGLPSLVGVDKYSDYPPQVRDLPKVGDFLDPSFEAILSLEPDLVVLDPVQGKVASRLEAAGIRTLVLRMHTIDDVRSGLARVATAIGTRAHAEAARQQLDAAIDAVRARATARRQRQRPTVLAVVERQSGGLGGMVAAGPGSFIDELLAIIDAENVMASSGLRYSSISAEQILRGRPDVILDSVHGTAAERPHEDWSRLSSVPAVANGRIYALTDTFYTSPGPRVGEALVGLERLIYGPDAAP